jgi:hypothetical protein
MGRSNRTGASRRAVIAGAGAGGLSLLAGGAFAQAPATVRLKALGTERALPGRWLGYNSPANYDIPIEDPTLASALAPLKPHLLRFPGGTVANYYQPETGQLDFGPRDGSIYRRYLNDYAKPNSVRLHPKGVWIEDYIRLCEKVGADLIVLPNLESSTVESQVAWFKRMNAGGYRPNMVEMGNEFYLALLMDPLTVKRFPDWATTNAITKDYADALRPYMDKDARVAIQAASARFHVPYGEGGDARQKREHIWDNDMKPQPWAQAVTVHLYPTIEASAGKGSLAGLPGNVDKVFPAFMAHTDAGYTRSISDTIARMPGMEIWNTEWGAFEPAATLGGARAEFDGMWMHQICRSILTMLRFKEVTAMTIHALFFSGNLMSAFRRAGGVETIDRGNGLGAGAGTHGEYVPINFTSVMQWFCEAGAGPDSHYRTIAVEGAREVAGNGAYEGESYRDVDACLLRRGQQRTLFVQNADRAPRRIDLSDLLGAGTGVTADALVTTNLTDSLQLAAPKPQPLPAGRTIDAPGYSIVRVRWTD